jgi:acyl-CoA dehydrogenase
VTDQAISICGGWGYVRELPVQRWHRDAKIYTLFEGTREIQRRVIARAISKGASELQ